MNNKKPLNGPSFESTNNPKKLVFLLHGYGGDGKDISMLTLNWKRHMPNTVFICPNGHETCPINPSGFQWFDLTKDDTNYILDQSIKAEEKIKLFINEIKQEFNLTNNQICLSGFSQGCMMSIQIALKKKKQISCLIGYSGKVINQKHLSDNIHSKPKIFLMHGANDTLVPPTHLLEAKEYLVKHGLKIKTKLFKDCEHRIPVEGVSLGLGFLKKNLL